MLEIATNGICEKHGLTIYAWDTNSKYNVKKDGNWIVIELNDGQESGYAGVNKLQLWQKIIGIESGK